MGLVEQRLSHRLKLLHRWTGVKKAPEPGNSHRIAGTDFLVRLDKQLAVIPEVLLGVGLAAAVAAAGQGADDPRVYGAGLRSGKAVRPLHRLRAGNDRRILIGGLQGHSFSVWIAKHTGYHLTFRNALSCDR